MFKFISSGFDLQVFRISLYDAYSPYLSVDTNKCRFLMRTLNFLKPTRALVYTCTYCKHVTVAGLLTLASGRTLCARGFHNGIIIVLILGK